MIRVALRSLVHDTSKFIASLAGVAFAAVLVFVQTGLYAGFLDTTSSIIGHMRGDVWVMSRGTEVLDTVETMSPSARASFASHPCVSGARPLVFTWSQVRKPNGNLDNVRVIGIERPSKTVPLLPWQLERGLPGDLEAPGRIAIESFDLPKLQIAGDPVGQRMEVGGRTVKIAAVTQGVRSFTLLPFIFAEIEQARAMTNLKDGQASYWVLDLTDPRCADDVIQTVSRNPELQAIRTADFMAKTQKYWLEGSGAGGVLAFAAMLGLLVGAVVVGQTLYAIVRDHKRELATLKALGASSSEIVRFVFWQAAFLAVAGIVIGTLVAFGMRSMAAGAGLVVVLSPWVLAVGAGAVIVMCALSSILGVRSVLRLEAAEVFK
jgi:putative ABC transport system permease protein